MAINGLADRSPASFASRPILFILGLLIIVLGVAMLVPAVVDYARRDHGSAEDFLTAAAVSVALGGLLIAGNYGRIGSFSLRQAYVLTFACWTAVPAVAALPLAFSDLRLSYTDAFFETMSGLTTTGSTVLIGLDTMTPSILLWRALLQWLGGIGIIVMAIAILPWLRTGGMQLFRTESSDRSDKPMARMSEITAAICLAYLALTVACAFAYEAAGMTSFEAAVHAMTTLSTGGYSTRDTSFAGFSPTAQWLSIVFMLAGAMPFILFVRAVRGDWAILRDRQTQGMLLVFLATTLALTLWLFAHNQRPPLDAVRAVAFNVASIMTTTGYVSEDFGLWGPFAVAVFFYLMFVGGCTGSTAGAIKIFRFRVLLIVLADHVRHRFMPHVMGHRTYDGKPLTADVVEGVMAFLALYFATVAAVAITLAAFGLDWLTALSGTVQAVGNVGPGLGPEIGPAGNFAGLPDGAKWVLAFGMLVGRLELFTALVLLSPHFWRG